MFQLAIGYLFSTKAALTGNWAQNDPNIFTISDVCVFFSTPYKLQKLKSPTRNLQKNNRKKYCCSGSLSGRWPDTAGTYPRI